MRFSLRAVVFAWAAGALISCPTISRAAAPDNTPEALVRAALSSQLQGPSDERNKLLAEALRLDPNYAPARWQSGFVRIGDEWVKVDDVPKRLANDPQWAAYRQKRDALVDTADNHRELARWCRRNRLNDVERVHWARVLEFDPQDAEALEALGLELYEGRLMTREQIEQAKIAAGDRLRALRRWQPQLVKLRRAIERGSDAQREAALAKLGKIDDPSAIEALEAVFGVDGQGEKIVALNSSLMETIGRMQHPAATQVLLRRAVLGEPEEVRDLAIDQLKKRPMHAYVPQLIAAIPGKLSTKFRLYVSTAGTLVREEEILFEGKDTEYYISREQLIGPGVMIGVTPGRLVMPWQPATVFFPTQAKQLAESAASAQSYQQWSREVTTRVQHALEQTTGFTHADEAESLERQWKDYNDWYNSPYPKTKRRVSLSQQAAYIPVVRTQSCFPAGTPVLTSAGEVPIEAIKLGDQVLSQDVRTGELVYKPVQATTLRGATPMVTLDCGAEVLRATRGHPFWVVAEGWRVAKFLRPGDRLHTLNGVVEIKAVGEERPSEAYNLVVSEFHNYFVGAQHLLAHDNSPQEETTSLVPGLPVHPEDSKTALRSSP